MSNLIAFSKDPIPPRAAELVVQATAISLEERSKLADASLTHDCPSLSIAMSVFDVEVDKEPN